MFKSQTIRNTQSRLAKEEKSIIDIKYYIKNTLNIKNTNILNKKYKNESL